MSYLEDISNKNKIDLTKAKSKQLEKIIYHLRLMELNEQAEDVNINVSDAWWNRFIIPVDSEIYNFWEIFLGMVSIICSVNYAYFTAFGFPFRYVSLSDTFATAKDYPFDTAMIIFWFLIEFLFGLDIVLNFLREFRDDNTFKPIRDIQKIAERYVKTQFILDMIATIPFNYILHEAVHVDQ